MPDTLRVSPPPSLREQVASNLRAAIASGTLKPGERLVERVLCERMAVSRTSIREALRELQNEGLVTNLPNRGLIIAKPSRTQSEAIFEARAALESLICRLFAQRATADQMRDFEAAFHILRKSYAGGDARDIIAAKNSFYDALMRGAGNEVVERMLRSLHIRVSQLRMASLSSPERNSASLREIENLVTSILARDAERAEALSRHHVEMAARSALGSPRRD